MLRSEEGSRILEEYLKKYASKQAEWHTADSSIKAVRFVIPMQDEAFHPLVQTERGNKLEAFFCLDGGMILQRTQKSNVLVDSRSIILLDEPHAKTWSGKIQSSLIGILITLECWPDDFCSNANLGCDPSRLHHCLAAHQGCMVFHNSDWVRALFIAIRQLPLEQQQCYSIYKFMELLYLLGHSNLAVGLSPQSINGNDYMAQRIQAMCLYMEQHLQEKLTIPQLCVRFYLSPTSLKKYFRNLYGQPVHSWLQKRRMEKAAEILRESSLTVLQTAQQVGYEGLSQFNAAFKRTYGCTPKQYRNMSKTVDFRLFSQDESV